MQPEEATIGQKVRVRVGLPGLPEGTVGIITDEYDREEIGQKGRGIIVTWQVTGHAYRDGFSPEELQYLEVAQ